MLSASVGISMVNPANFRLGQLGQISRAHLGHILRRGGLVSNLEYYREIPSLLEQGWPVANANLQIQSAISRGAPYMACRLGRGEIRFLSKVLLRQSLGVFEVSVHRYLEGTDMAWARKDLWFRENLHGSTRRAAEFLDLYLSAMKEADLLGSWSPGESIFADSLREVLVDELWALEPFRHKKPWSSGLEGKSVLVIHPFASSIEYQFRNFRKNLFEDPLVLPDFSLETLVPFMDGIRDADRKNDLIDQYLMLRDEMLQRSFDVVIIGAGPIGYLLAADAKRAGRISVHLGGATQLLFGIRGKRWEEMAHTSRYFNRFWVSPSESETPDKFELHYDRGAYW